MRFFGHPYNDLVICKDSPDYLHLTLVVRLPGVPGSPRRTRRRLPGVPGSKKKKKKFNGKDSDMLVVIVGQYCYD